MCVFLLHILVLVSPSIARVALEMKRKGDSLKVLCCCCSGECDLFVPSVRSGRGRFNRDRRETIIVCHSSDRNELAKEQRRILHC